MPRSIENTRQIEIKSDILRSKDDTLRIKGDILRNLKETH